jgi:hypothetical protein
MSGTDELLLGIRLLNEMLAAAQTLGLRIQASRDTGVKLDLAPFRAEYAVALARFDADIARAEAEGR